MPRVLGVFGLSRFGAATALLAVAGCSAPAPTSMPPAASRPGTSAPAPDESRTRGSEFTRVVMGVQARIRIAGSEPREAMTAAAAAFRTMADLEAVISDYRLDSDVTRLAESAGGPAVPIAPAMVDALQTARTWAARTDGAFDPTVGPATQAWRAVRDGGEPLAEAERERLAGLIDWRRVELDAAERVARLPVPGMRLDFGGIGKGMAADAAISTLRAAGHPSALVSVAGDVAAGDPPPGAAGWRVIAGRDGEVAPARLLIANQAISTSGDTGQYVEIDGRRYAHIVDPRTGIGLTVGRAVSVLAQSATDADALASALTVMGDSATARRLLAATPGAAARFHDVVGDDTRTVVVDPHGTWAAAVARAAKD